MDAEGVLAQNSASVGMCTLPDLTRFKAINGDACVPLTMSGRSSSVALTEGSAAEIASDRSVHCYTTKQFEMILESVVVQTAEQFEINVGQAGTQKCLLRGVNLLNWPSKHMRFQIRFVLSFL